MFFTICILLAAGLFAMNIVLGSTSISVGEIISALAGKSEGTSATIIMNIRLPRAVAALVLGGALALSGYLLQTFFANPIVGPYVLGISSGAKLCVALMMIYVLSRGKNIGLVGMIVSKAVKMAEMMNIPVLGIVENLSYFKCPDCGKIHEIFGKSNVDSVAADFGIPVTVRLPIDPDMAALCDKGEAHKLKAQDIEDKFDALTEEVLK